MPLSFPVVSHMVFLCCPHLVNKTHDARSICRSSNKCGESCQSAGKMERHTHTLYVCKGGGSPEAKRKELEGFYWGPQTGDVGRARTSTACAQVSFCDEKTRSVVSRCTPWVKWLFFSTSAVMVTPTTVQVWHAARPTSGHNIFLKKNIQLGQEVFGR